MTTLLAVTGLAALALAVAAYLSVRRQRAAFLATLSAEQREQLRGFEAVRGWGSWREFAELPK